MMPLFPIAHAAQAAGWSVTLAAPPETESSVTFQGLQFAALSGIAGDDPRRGQALARMGELPRGQAEPYFVREIFGRLNTTGTLPNMQRLVEELDPAVIVSESFECAGNLVAEAKGISRFRVHPGLTTLPFEGDLAEGLIELRKELGLSSHDAKFRLREAGNIAYMPLEMEYPAARPTAALRIRDPRYTPRDLLSQETLVYVTFGSEAAAMPFFTGVVQGAMDALAHVGVRGLVALGKQGNPQDFEVPPGISVSTWVDQAEVLGRASAVVCHGGSGTVLAALSCGVPMILVPLFADQPYNAERVAANAAGLVVSTGPRLAERLAPALEQVLQGPMPGTLSLLKTIAALPGPQAAVALF